MAAKRTMDALERRFAVEAELLQQKQKKQSHGDKKVTRGVISSDAAPTSNFFDPSVPSTSLNNSLKKGNISFSGQMALKDSEANGPAYLQLFHPVHENLITANDVVCGGGSMVNNMLHEFLQKGDFAQKYIQGSKSVKIDNWILLDNLVQGRRPSAGSCIRTLLRQSKCSKKHVSMKQHKNFGSLDLPQELHKYDVFKPMHDLWEDYMAQLLQNTGKSELAQCLLHADLHGAMILVVHCKIASFTGVSGIMIRETAETFGIITQDNKFRVVPKKVSVFVFHVDCWKITLRGDKLTLRNLGSK